MKKLPPFYNYCDDNENGEVIIISLEFIKLPIFAITYGYNIVTYKLFGFTVWRRKYI